MPDILEESQNNVVLHIIDDGSSSSQSASSSVTQSQPPKEPEPKQALSEVNAGEDPLYKYYPGKVVYKKRKARTSPVKSIISGKEFRVQMLKKPKKNKKGNEWMCAYCDISYDDDIKNNISKKWIECDNCHSTQHIQCLPRSHLDLQNFDFDEEENDFLCEKCFSE